MRFQGGEEQCEDVGAQQRSGLGASVVHGPDTGRRIRFRGHVNKTDPDDLELESTLSMQH